MSAVISNANDAISWLTAQGIQRVEVVFADLTSVARGKVMDTANFVEALGAKMPTLLLGLTVTGGEPLAQADAVFRFKRLAREFARRHGCLATFMAKPYADEPGTGMHWHVSLSDRAGHNAFTADDGSAHPRMAHFIGGWQASAPGAMAVLAPYAHSYLRIRRPDASPTHADWGHDDRTVAFRIPQSNPANRRLEHRLPGGDANPYLTLALMLGTGLMGMEQQLEPRSARNAAAASTRSAALPEDLGEALTALQGCPLLGEVFGAGFIALYAMVKRHELTEQAADADFALRHLLGRSYTAGRRGSANASPPETRQRPCRSTRKIAPSRSCCL